MSSFPDVEGTESLVGGGGPRARLGGTLGGLARLATPQRGETLTPLCRIVMGGGRGSNFPTFFW